MAAGGLVRQKQYLRRVAQRVEGILRGRSGLKKARGKLFDNESVSRVTLAITAPVYQYYPILVDSLRLQTHVNWRLYLVHDGRQDESVRRVIEAVGDPRIRYWCTQERYNDWGHSLRQIALERVREDGDCEYVLMTNADNYYVPGFIKQMLMELHPGDVGVFCDMVHSHRKWALIQSRLKRKFIDCGAVILRSDIACSVGWNHRDFAADWHFIEEVLAAGGGPIRRLPRPLFVHN